MSDSIDFEHEYETESGDVIPLFVTMEFSVYTDHNYGADADGNRGRSVTFTENEELTIELENGLDITPHIKKHLPKLYKEIEKEAELRVEKQLEDPEYGQYDNYN